MAIVDRLCMIYGSTAAGFVSHDVILCYHTVRDRNKPARGWLSHERSVDVELFYAQMRWLKECTEVATIRELLTVRPLNRRVRVAVTFDDGYFDNINVVRPILKELGIPITWFIATDFIDRPDLLPWWDLIDLVLEKCTKPLEFRSEGVAGIFDPLKGDQRKWLNKSLRRILKSSDPIKRDQIVSELKAGIEQQIHLPLNSFSRADEIASTLSDGLIELGGHSKPPQCYPLLREPIERRVKT